MLEEKIQQLRDEPGGFRRLSKQVEMSPSAVCLIIQRKRNPSVNALRRLCRGLEVTADEMLAYLDPTPTSRPQTEQAA